MAQNIKKNPKAIWKYANSKLKKTPKLGDLQKVDGSLTQDDKMKAELLNTFLQVCLQLRTLTPSQVLLNITKAHCYKM